MPRRDLRPAAANAECLQGVLERQPHLLRVPAAGHPRGDGLTPADLDPEALEAQRSRACRGRIVIVAEAIARFLFAAASAHGDLARALDSPPACGAAIQAELFAGLVCRSLAEGGVELR